MKHRLALGLALLVASGSLVALAAPPKSPYLGTWTARLSRAQMINDGLDVRLCEHAALPRLQPFVVVGEGVDGRSGEALGAHLLDAGLQAHAGPPQDVR